MACQRQQPQQQQFEQQHKSAPVNSRVRAIMQASLAGGGLSTPSLSNADETTSLDRQRSTTPARDEAELGIDDLRKALREARHHEAEAKQRAEQHEVQAMHYLSEAEKLTEQLDQARNVALAFLRHTQTKEWRLTERNNDMGVAELVSTALAASESHRCPEAEAETEAATAASPRSETKTTPEPTCPASTAQSVAEIIREVLASGMKLWRLQEAQRALFPHGNPRTECSSMGDKGHHADNVSKPTRTPAVGDDIAAKLLVEMSQALHRLEEQAH